jgi:PAT family beta-lactamase induction signal transducer AmpG
MECLTAGGAPAAHVGYTSWFHLPVTLKPLWSPLVDLWSTKRRWLLATQFVMGIMMMLVGAVVSADSGGSSSAAFWIVLGALAIVHAVHDIACDGLYLLALDTQEQALYSGTRIAAFRVAMYVGGSGLVMMAAAAGFPSALTAAGAIMSLTGAINAWVVPRPVRDRPLANDTNPIALPARIAASYATFLTQPKAVLVLAFVVTFGLSDALTFAMSSPLLADLGVDLAARAAIRAMSLTATIGGSILGGALISRVGLERLLVPLTYLMALPFYFLIAVWQPPFWGIALLVITEQFTGNLAATALTVFLMRRSRLDFSASHYAFFTALAAVSRTVAGGLSGHLFDSVSHETYFAVAFFAAIPAVILAHWVPKAPLEQEPHSRESQP